ncbi:unnamed protein product [Cuscuta epithymum]|uniref:Kinesin motor domain-containing protein n=1 Tax=Cuscuta epithymum TaxID=186058 RepID=A0AAV0FFX3_9ASTE|nr:unnamed protein product [Cuscuta epithymum]
MPLISEAQSAMKSRFGFHDSNHSSSEQTPQAMLAVKSSPDLRMLKSACKERKENHDADTAQTALSNQQRSFEFREDPAFWKEHNVQVIIRVRPLSGSEISLYGRSQCVKQDSSQTITWTGHPESRFTFDLIADENVTQEMLFKVAGVPMVENCVEGYNSCMFAYGQTGSGKTHTMLGDIDGGTRRHSVNCGMTPRVFEYLFSRIQKEKEARREEKIRFICRCSFLEIYNEQILDLLDPSSVNLQIREDTKKGIHVENLTEVEVTSARDVIQQLVQGAANRKVASTNMNRASSRSHSVFTCVIESKWESQGVTHHRFARLNLVDLAGSERQKSSGAEGERLKEATNINKSLSTLGLVIMNLVNMSNGKSLHVPYRDSKLTFLLQDSLGGNAKTIIIANVSPSSSCSLETLSTLKFAQRAKFIKNHAVINEDASGDILAMRVQIQNLKKEVARLRSMVNVGADACEVDSRTVALPGSPTSMKWEGIHGLSSPLASDKKMSYKKDYEVALVGAFRREKDKDIAMQALTAENQAAMQLAKQREDEIQGLKMRLRFRESAIKRLESVASGKISAETHLLKEKEEHLKEMEVLRNQVDRNQEVTRFAMENLRLKEEIRRLKSFYEEGERERMNEQVMILENQLREALDWKLMHGSDDIDTQKPAQPMRTAVDEENEFLRLQAIYNQSELDALRKKLDICVEEKENLERHISEMVKELESERCSKAAMMEDLKLQNDLSSLENNFQMPNIGVGDQVELETMVDAIAAASQREAEAHETAISLTKENDELKIKINVLIEGNQKLIELYEQAVADNKNSAKPAEKGCELLTGETEQLKREVELLKNQLAEMHEEKEKLMGLYENAVQEKKREEEMHKESERLMDLFENAMAEKKKDVECLNLQLREMHEENERLMSLYDIAMQDKKRDVEHLNNQLVEMHEENEKLMGLYENVMEENRRGIGSLDNQLVELHEENEKLMGLYEEAMKERDEIKRLLSSATEKKPLENKEEFHNLYSEDHNKHNNSASRNQIEEAHEDNASCLIDVDVQDEYSQYSVRSYTGNDSEELPPPSCKVSAGVNVEEKELVRRKLYEVQEKLLKSVNTVSMFGSLERALLEIDELSRRIMGLEDSIQGKHQVYESLKIASSELQEKTTRVYNKLSALRYTLSSFSSSVSFFEQQGTLARERWNTSLTHLNRKKSELAHLQASKDELMGLHAKAERSESELRCHLDKLKSRLEEENQRLDNDRVLFAIDNNVGKPEVRGKATELLKSTEETTKIQNQVKQCQEKLGALKTEIDDLNRKREKLDGQINIVEKEVKRLSVSAQEMENRLQTITHEKEMVLEMVKEEGKKEMTGKIVEYQQCVFEAALKGEEMAVLDEELQTELQEMDELKRARDSGKQEIRRLLAGLIKHEYCNQSIYV